MSLHILSHPWLVQDRERGPLVQVTARDLDTGTLAILTDELFDLAQESGRTDLTLDFAEVKVLPRVAVGKLLALDRRLREAGGCLLMCGLDPDARDSLLAAGWPAGPAPDALSSRGPGWAETQDCFVVFLRDGSAPPGRPEAVERPVAVCPTAEEAAGVREEFRRSGRSCVIRFVGPTGGGD
jgi:anti-anti-sigma regulatory factor